MKRWMLSAAVLALVLATAGQAQAQRVFYGSGWDSGNYGWYGPGYSYSGWGGGPTYRNSYYGGGWGSNERTSYYSGPGYYYSTPNYYAAPGYYTNGVLAAPTSPRQGSAQVRVLVPANAIVTFDGNATTQTGSDRLFVTPRLEAGRKYVYQIKAEWLVNGQRMSRTIDRDVHAGDMVNADFLSNGPADSTRSRTDVPRLENDAARPDEVRPSRTTIRPASDVTAPVTPGPATTTPLPPGTLIPSPLPANPPVPVPNPNPVPPPPQ